MSFDMALPIIIIPNVMEYPNLADKNPSLFLLINDGCGSKRVRGCQKCVGGVSPEGRLTH